MSYCEKGRAFRYTADMALHKQYPTIHKGLLHGRRSRRRCSELNYTATRSPGGGLWVRV